MLWIRGQQDTPSLYYKKAEMVVRIDAFHLFWRLLTNRLHLNQPVDPCFTNPPFTNPVRPQSCLTSPLIGYRKNRFLLNEV